MANSPKDVIYVDVDDEITAIIEKLQTSDGKIVAFVLPKRAAMFQSIVNMKLLKRTAESNKKNLVLITSEKSILPLAGAVGLHVAPTLQSKPTIPVAPTRSDAPVSVDEIEIGEAEPVTTTPVAAPATIMGLPKQESETDSITIDNDTPKAKPSKKVAAGGAAGAKSFNKKLKVPDFNKFRTKLLILAGVLPLLIIGLVVANVVLPNATVKIRTNTVDVPATASIVSSPSYSEVDIERGRVPGALKEYTKTEVQKAPATGQKDLGQKAEGEVTLSLTDCAREQVTVPAGTTLSANNLNFVTESAVTMQSVKIGPTCRNGDFKNISTAKVAVVAAQAGDQYNLSARNYGVAGFSNVSGAGEAMSGGTTQVVKIISQQDIDNLRNKIIETVNPTANEEVRKLLESENYYPLVDTFTAKDPVVTSNPGVNAEAEEVTVSVSLSYTMAGASRDGIEDILNAELEKEINKDQQKILNTGLSEATVQIGNKQPTGQTSFDISVNASAGVEQNVDDIRQAVAGKKKNEAESAIRTREGVIDVTVEYSPFWVSSVPDKLDKINVEFDQESTDNSNE